MSDEVKEIKPPKGFEHTEKFGGALVSDEGKIISLENRSFQAVDEWLGNLISSGIEAKIREQEGRKINILDLGSGTDSVACKDIGNKYGNQVNVVGLDLFPQIPGEAGTSVIQGNIASLPFKDESFDFVFSHKALVFLEHKSDETVVKEINRVLKPGGYAVLDWDSIGYMDGHIRKNLTDLASQLGLVWRSSVLKREDRMSQMVHVLFKPPVNQEFLAKFSEVDERLGLKENTNGDS